MSDTAKIGIKEVIFGSPLSVAGVVGLFADAIGLAVLAAGVIFGNQTAQLWARFLVLGALFAGAIGLLMLGAKGARFDSAQKVLQLYARIYALLAAISYACIVLVINLSEYTRTAYGGFWAILLAELLAFGLLRYISRPEDHGWFAVPLGASTIGHGVLLVVIYIVLFNPISGRIVVDNMILFVAMLVVSVLMYTLSELPGSAKRRRTLREKLP